MKYLGLAALLASVLTFAAQATTAWGEGPPTPGSEQKDNLSGIYDSLATLQQKVEALKERHWIRDFGPTVVSFLSLLLALVALWLTAKHNRRSIEEKSREEERKSIREKLDQFYGPFLHLRGVSKNLYRIFTARRKDALDDQARDNEGKFRTLIALLKGRQFEGIDLVLLDEIIAIGEQSEKLIQEKIGLVDDPMLQELIWKVAAHYRVIKLAKEGKLQGGGEEFSEFTFPYDLDTELQTRVKEFNDRLAELQRLG